MQAYHWKAHNIFTKFYLKDLTWSDDNDMYPGPLVAAKYTLPPQSGYPQEKKKGGAQPLQPSLPNPNTQEHQVTIDTTSEYLLK